MSSFRPFGSIIAPESWCAPSSGPFSITRIAGRSWFCFLHKSARWMTADSVAAPGPHEQKVYVQSLALDRFAHWLPRSSGPDGPRIPDQAWGSSTRAPARKIASAARRTAPARMKGMPGPALANT